MAQVLLSTRASNQFEFWLATVPSFLVTAYKLRSESTYSRIKMHSRLISPYPLSKQYGHSLDKDDNIFRKLCFGFLIIAWPLGLPKFLGSQFSMAILEIGPNPKCIPSLGSIGQRFTMSPEARRSPLLTSKNDPRRASLSFWGRGKTLT